MKKQFTLEDARKFAGNDFEKISFCSSLLKIMANNKLKLPLAPYSFSLIDFDKDDLEKVKEWFEYFGYDAELYPLSHRLSVKLTMRVDEVA